MFAMGAVLGAVLLSVTLGGDEDHSRLVVMTYNLRYASPMGSEAWPKRRPLVAQMIAKHRPDVLGTQEGVYAQLSDLADDLPDYAWIGLGRDGGSRGEFMAVFYRKSRLRPVSYDHFWLSDTPQVIGSSTWGNSNRRMVTWVRFKDRQNREFYFWNTHFDHMIQEAREKSADLVRQRALGRPTALPILLVGDFNAEGGKNKAYHRLVSSDAFADAWNAATHKGDQEQTFNGFRYPASKKGPRIDWILWRGPLEPISIEVDAAAVDHRYPSDHFPVIAAFKWPGK